MKNLIILFLLFTGLANGQTIALSSATGTDSQTVCYSNPIVNIQYTTTGVTGATVTGLPTGITSVWAANVVTISGTSTTSGVFNYTVTTTGGSGSVTANGTITVQNQINAGTITSASPSICVGQTTQLNATVAGGTWSVSNPAIATINPITGVLTGISAGVVTIIYIIPSNGVCPSAVTATTVVVNPNIPTTVSHTSSVGTDNQTVCDNSPIVNISYTTTGATGATVTGLPSGITGSWTGGVYIISGASVISGVFNYTVTTTGGCGSVTANGTITVIPNNTATLTSASNTNNQTVLSGNPIVNVTYATTGATGATISGLPTGVSSSWVGNVVVISGTPTTLGTFNYTVTLTGGCGLVTTTGTIYVVNSLIATATPAIYTVCDTDNDGVATFNLQTQDSSILNGQSQSQFMVRYYETLTDAQNNFNQISDPSAYTNTLIPNNQTLYARVTEFANPTNFATTTLTLIVNLPPAANTPPDLLIPQNPFIGTAVFDLTTQNTAILNGQATYTVNYYTTLNNAYSGSPIVNPASYLNISNTQTIWYKVVNSATGCYTISHFLIGITNPNIVYIPDANFKTTLINIGIDTNTDGEIQYSEALVPTNLNLDFGNIENLIGIEAFVNLTVLSCRSNNITSLNLSNNINLQFLNANANNLHNVNISNCINLTFINFGYAYINTLDLSNNTNLVTVILNISNISNLILPVSSSLTHLDITQNGVSNLNVSILPNLQYLDCSNNPMHTLNTNSLTNLQTLNCHQNQLATLNVQGLTSLQTLDCSYNQINTLNVQGLTSLQTLNCSKNQLTSLEIKNGSNEILNFSDNLNLQFICADDSQVDSVQSQVISLGYTNCVANSYCSFTPGGPYNTISGTAQYDANSNGCDATDPVFKELKVNINDGTNSGSTFTNGLGVYSFYTQQPNYTLTPWLENPTYFTVSPATTSVNFPANNGSTATRDFCITANGVHNDLEVVLVPIGAARPGFDANYQLVYKNKGNTTLSGTVNLVFDDAVLDFVSAAPAVDSQTINNLNWNYSNLLPFEVRVINIILNLNSPLETPPLNSGSLLNFISTINPVAGDDLPLDNVFNLNQTVVNSYDPNDKTCLEGNIIDPTKIGEYLHYNINFENTGTADAINVVVKDVIDTSMFEMNTLQVISASHDLKTEIKSNQVEFIFKNINLRHNPRGHGNVLFKIRTKPNLVVGSEVANTANIYFDYNFPIITNEARTIFQSLSTGDFETDNSVNIYPNPASDFVNIKCNSAIKSVQLFDIQGRIIQTIIENKSITKIDISNQQNGIYFLKIVTDEGVKVERFVRE